MCDCDLFKYNNVLYYYAQKAKKYAKFCFL